MNKALVIYDLTGEIFAIKYGEDKVPVGLLYMWVDIPDGCILSGIDVSDPNNHKAIIKKVNNTDIQRLQEQIDEVKEVLNPTLDVENCTLEEAINFTLAKFAKACTAMIENGQEVETSKGIFQFSYGLYDQLNLQAAYTHAIATGMNVPYHANKVDCTMWPALDIVKIYGKNLYAATYHTTYCNLLNNICRACKSVKDVVALEYGMNLPSEQSHTLYSIMAETQKLFDAEMKKFEEMFVYKLL